MPSFHSEHITPLSARFLGGYFGIGMVTTNRSWVGRPSYSALVHARLHPHAHLASIRCFLEAFPFFSLSLPTPSLSASVSEGGGGGVSFLGGEGIEGEWRVSSKANLPLNVPCVYIIGIFFFQNEWVTIVSLAVVFGRNCDRTQQWYLLHGEGIFSLRQLGH